MASGKDAASGLPVVSLYGERTKPRPEDLAGLDVLVVDLQDAGVRFYTYASTMLLCLEAAAEAGIELVVLDRPNPLGGARAPGPSRDPAEDLPSSLVNMAPGPLVHGLTLGEMARYVNARKARPARLTVVPMTGWSRSMTWADTGRPWVAPSPNLRTAEAALVYPGTCLLEADERDGRPGHRGALPVVRRSLAADGAARRRLKAPGLRLEPRDLRPRRPRRRLREPEASRRDLPGLPCARGGGGRCATLCVRPRAPRALRSTQPDLKWVREGAWLDTLLGTRRVRRALERGDAVDAVLAADEPGLEGFARERKAALLY